MSDPICTVDEYPRCVLGLDDPLLDVLEAHVGVVDVLVGIVLIFLTSEDGPDGQAPKDAIPKVRELGLVRDEVEFAHDARLGFLGWLRALARFVKNLSARLCLLFLPLCSRRNGMMIPSSTNVRSNRT